ncbi:DUF1707 SHOCT-like domain-containing protein [Streptomyces sp. NBC_01477]|uniref:DUF1707 SHOCT-like domain-containing protein n=1 Tax=Streptomyces sp. NBC_01477 TaxID=2976015 RepID=UPI003FCD9B3F
MDESQLQKPAQQPVEPVRRPETAVAAPSAAAPATSGPAASAPAAEADLRASDADRDRIADILREALAEGRLDSAEHSERLDRVYAAKTLGELLPLVRDLPVGRTASPAPAPAYRGHAGDGSGENPHLVGILGGAERKGRWRVGHKITAVAILGGVEIDLSEATFTAPELVIHCTAVMGGVTIKLPENVTLRGGGVIGIMGGSDIKAYESTDPGAPVVRVDGFAFWGGVEAKAKRGKKVKDWTRKHLGN